MLGTKPDSVKRISIQGTEPLIPPAIQEKVRLPFYNLASKLPGPKNTGVRIFMFSFLGTQLPLFALLIYVLVSVELTNEVMTTFNIVLITALVGSASTVIALIAYAEPVNAISKAMHDFTVHDHLPNLPEGYRDEIGELMANTQGALKKLHSMLHNMHELSIRDELTGLYNRRFFGEQSEQLLLRAARYGEPFTLVFIDMDNFKQINDRYSHQAGDHALRQIASLMSDTARGTDLTARIGGDEFVILCPNTTIEKARMQVDRLCNNMSRFDWSALFADFVPTMSIGIAQAIENDNIEKLMDRADANLHKAKNEGRNQIVS
ncbi:MAG: GGDEF domain-containing protein [Pseudomonadota bacterium]